MERRSTSQPLGPDGVSQTGELAIDRERSGWGPPLWAQLNYVAMAGLRMSSGRCRGSEATELF